MTEISDEVLLGELLSLPKKKITETLKNKDLVSTIKSIVDDLKAVSCKDHFFSFQFFLIFFFFFFFDKGRC